MLARAYVGATTTEAATTRAVTTAAITTDGSQLVLSSTARISPTLLLPLEISVDVASYLQTYVRVISWLQFLMDRT